MAADLQHQAVLDTATVDAWFTDPDGIYIDGTFGRGGHSLEILKKLDNLDNKGKLLAIDQDPEAIQYANNHPIFSTDKRFKLIQSNFSQLKNICEQNNLKFSSI